MVDKDMKHFRFWITEKKKRQMNQSLRQLFSKNMGQKNEMHLRKEREPFCSKNDKNLANPIFPPFSSEELLAWKYPIEIWNICLTRN